VASIEKWKGGRYRARWRDANGRTQAKVFARKVDAEQHLKRVGADLVRGEYIAPTLAASRFDVWADRWWATTGKLTSNTRRGYHVMLTNHVRPHFGGMRMDRIDWPEVERFLGSKLEAGISPKKVRDMVSVVSLVMRTAIAGGARRDNPAAGHTIPQRRGKLRQGDVLTMEQAHRLAAETRDPYKPAVWLMVLLGLRPAELCGLRVRSVDFVRGTVHVAETLNAVHSFPGHDYGIETGPTKTEAGDRVLPIPAWLRDDLAAILAARGDVTPDGYLFLAVKGSVPLRVADLRRWVIRPALKAAGDPDLRPPPLARVALDRPGRQPARGRPPHGAHRSRRNVAGLRAPVHRSPGEAHSPARRAPRADEDGGRRRACEPRGAAPIGVSRDTPVTRGDTKTGTKRAYFGQARLRLRWSLTWGSMP
jgi:integrase